MFIGRWKNTIIVYCIMTIIGLQHMDTVGIL